MIREATHADIPRLVEMGTRFIASTPAYRNMLRHNPVQLAALMGRLIEAKEAALLVADWEGCPVGMIAVVVAPSLLSGEMVGTELFWWVDPTWRGRLGPHLLRVGETWARAQGATVLQMVAPDDRVARLYRRRGYIKLEESYQRAL